MQALRIDELFNCVSPVQTVRLLNRQDIPQMLSLQERAGDDQIIRKTRADLENHFANGQTAFGIFHDQTLVGQAMIRNEHVAANMLGCAFKQAAGQDLVHQTTLGCVVIAPEVRGQGLMQMLVRLWLSDMAARGIEIAHARVKIDNPASWKSFMRHGLEITSTGPSPDDPSRTVYRMHKRLGPQDIENGHPENSHVVNTIRPFG